MDPLIPDPIPEDGPSAPSEVRPQNLDSTVPVTKPIKNMKKRQTPTTLLIFGPIDPVFGLVFVWYNQIGPRSTSMSPYGMSGAPKLSTSEKIIGKS